MAQNDNWGGNLAAAFVSAGAFPLAAGSTDAALDFPVDGPYTAQVSGTGPGIMLVEVYDTGSSNSARLIN